jgi:hypothetical protein
MDGECEPHVAVASGEVMGWGCRLVCLVPHVVKEISSSRSLLPHEHGIRPFPPSISQEMTQVLRIDESRKRGKKGTVLFLLDAFLRFATGREVAHAKSWFELLGSRGEHQRRRRKAVLIEVRDDLGRGCGA